MLPTSLCRGIRERGFVTALSQISALLTYLATPVFIAARINTNLWSLRIFVPLIPKAPTKLCRHIRDRLGAPGAAHPLPLYRLGVSASLTNYQFAYPHQSV
jgi:hypothetical protein